MPAAGENGHQHRHFSVGDTVLLHQPDRWFPCKNRTSPVTAKDMPRSGRSAEEKEEERKLALLVRRMLVLQESKVFAFRQGSPFNG